MCNNSYKSMCVIVSHEKCEIHSSYVYVNLIYTLVCSFLCLGSFTRLRDFDINVSIDNYNPLVANHTSLCAHHEGSVGQAEHVTITCDVPIYGR